MFGTRVELKVYERNVESLNMLRILNEKKEEISAEVVNLIRNKKEVYYFSHISAKDSNI